jgi:hypothetical protein
MCRGLLIRVGAGLVRLDGQTRSPTGLIAQLNFLKKLGRVCAVTQQIGETHSMHRGGGE